MVLTVPPPIGVPAEAVAAGVAARAAAMAAAGPCASVEDAIRVVRAGAGAQDEAVLLWHLTTHTAGELRDTFPAEVLAELVRRGLPVG